MMAVTQTKTKRLLKLGTKSISVRLIILLIFASALFVLPTSIKPNLFPQPLLERFRQVTVKVQIGDTWGSGVIIQHQGSFYWVLTNNHVLEAGKDYCVHPYDNKSYAATAVETKVFNGLDVGLLVFSSQKQTYPTQSLSSGLYSLPGTPVMAVGYPFLFQDNKQVGYVALPGKIEIVLKTPLTEGFSLAYSNPVVKGMSGGGIFNPQGELIGINGIHAYPLWDGDYKYINGKNLTPQLNQQLQKLSIGIPISIIWQRLQQSKLSPPKLSSLSCSGK